MIWCALYRVVTRVTIFCLRYIIIYIVVVIVVWKDMCVNHNKFPAVVVVVQRVLLVRQLPLNIAPTW